MSETYRQTVEKIVSSSWSPATKLVAIYLWGDSALRNRSDTDVTATQLGRELSLHTKTVANSIHELEGAGLLEWEMANGGKEGSILLCELPDALPLLPPTKYTLEQREKARQRNGRAQR